MEQDLGEPHVQKKRLDDALAGLRETGKTSHELLLRVSRARKINAVLGSAAVMPWDVGALDEEWTELLDGLYEYEEKKAEDERLQAESKMQFENVLARRRAENSSYRKY